MDSTILAALYGLGGTLVGAGVSGWASLRTLRQQAETTALEQKEARSKLVEERGRAAGEKALTELYALRTHVTQLAPEWTLDEQRHWRQVADQHADQAELASGLIPQAEELRTRIKDALEVVRISVYLDSQDQGESYATVRDTDHAIDLLSAYMRGDDLPEPSARVERRLLERAEYELENPPDLD